MVNTFPSPVDNYHSLLIRVLSHLRVGNFFISSCFCALIGKSDGLKRCFRRSLPFPLAAAYFLHLDEPPKPVFGAHFAESIWRQLLMALTFIHSTWARASKCRCSCKYALLLTP